LAIPEEARITICQERTMFEKSQGRKGEGQHIRVWVISRSVRRTPVGDTPAQGHEEPAGRPAANPTYPRYAGEQVSS
jgi:hypothetical protein